MASEDLLLQQQISDLNDTIELLTLDKEQLIIDKELLEEKIFLLENENKQLHQQFKPQTNPSTKESQYLQTENLHLKETVTKLNDLLSKEKQLKIDLERQLLSLQTIDQTYQQYKQQTEETIQDLRNQVDSLSQFESLIEKLTTENESLKYSLQESRQTITVLEDAIELNEQLDDQQRHQIDADRKIIESYEMKTSLLEQKIIEKDILFNDVMKKLDTLKDSFHQVKEENEKLHQILLTENQQYQEIEEKLQLLQQSKQLIEQTTENFLMNESLLFQQYLLRSRYQVNTLRYEQLYGNLSYSIEETKNMNAEIIILAAVTVNFEIQHQLSVLYSSLQSHHDKGNLANAENENGNYGKLKSILLQWMMFSIILHQYLIHFLFLLLHPESDQTAVDSANYQALLVIKTELEQFLTELSLIVQQTIPGSVVIFSKEEASNSTGVVVISAKEIEIYFSKLTNALISLERLIDSFIPSAASSPVAVIKLLSGAQGFNTTLLERNLLLESQFLAFATVIESIQISSPMENTEQTDLIKSIKIEFDIALSSLGFQLSGHYSELHSLITALYSIASNHFLTSYGFFAFPSNSNEPKSKELVQPLKEILTLLRQLNIQFNGETIASDKVIALQYYPAYINTVLKPNKAVISSLLLPETVKETRLNYYAVLDKYWKLLIHENSELLLSGFASETSAVILKEANWKKRCSSTREVIQEKLFASIDRHDFSSVSHDDEFGAINRRGITLEAGGSSKNNKEKDQKYQEIKKQLEIKSEELAVAKQRCQELQEIANQSMVQLEAASVLAASTSVQKTVEEKLQLQSEIKILESALQTLEEKVDQLTKENKLLKLSGGSSAERLSGAGNAANSSNVISSTGSASASAASKDKSTRRRSNVEITDTKAFLTALANKEPTNLSTSKSNTSTSEIARKGSSPPTDPSSNSEILKPLRDEIQYWKSMCVKNLTVSLLPLDHPKQRATPASIKLTEEGKFQEIKLSDGLTAQIPQRYEDVTSNLKKVYYESRLQRIRSIKLAPTATTLEEGSIQNTPQDRKKLLESKKYLFYHDPILFQLISTQR